MKPRKPRKPVTRPRRLKHQPSPPTSSLTHSPPLQSPEQHQKRFHASSPPLQPEQALCKESLNLPDREPVLANWFLHEWLERSSEEVQEQAIEATKIRLVTDRPISFQKTMAESQPDRSSPTPPSTVTTQCASSPLYRSTLRLNDILVDSLGAEVPHDLRALLDKYVWKKRESPPFGDAEKAQIIKVLGDIWDSAELVVSDIVKTALFPFDSSEIQEGRNTLWSLKPVPRNQDSPIAIPAPKPDYHFGYKPPIKSKWTKQELHVAEHPSIRSYTQPSRENLFPSFIVEIKSEATGGTLYAAENQLAGSGAHRVRSLIALLDMIDPKRKRKCTDAIVFSAAVTQRGAVEHLHYYDTEKDMFCMSYIAEFAFLKDAQACHDFHQNIADWLLNVQQPAVREVLRKLQPVTQSWKKSRLASVVADACASESGRSHKRHQT